jgi:predicted dehydrogenase
MTTRLRAGIIGAGFIATVHAQAIRNSGHELFAIASSSLESAELAAAKLNITKVFATWQDLVASSDIDVVHICTPNELHAEIAVAAARANKHVVCEKPISVNLTEAAQIEAEVSKQGVGFAVPFAYRFYPIVREMRARVQNGEAGPVHLIHGNYLQDWLAEPTSTNWRVDSTSGGESRAFADVGTHWCDLMEYVTGDRISRLIANTAKAYQTRNGHNVQTEDIATILFETASGATGTLTVSQVSFGRKNQLLLEVDGSKASYTFNQEQPDSLFVGGRNSNQIIMRGNDTLSSEDGKRLSHLPSGHPQGYQDAFNDFIADAYESFQGRAVEGVPNLQDGLRAAVLIEAVLSSAKTGTWVNVAEVTSPTKTKMLAS